MRAGGGAPSSRDRAKELAAMLERGVQEAFGSQRFKEWLDTMGRFHRYSANNAVLIWMQMPQATLVAGYGDWQKKFGRHVKRGEKAIRILAPCAPRRDPDEEPDEGPAPAPRFRAVSVFDVSQTEGRELPEICRPLDGDPDGAAELLEALLRTSPVPVDFGPVAGGANGLYSQSEGRIVVAEGLPPLQTLKTLAHEIAHAALRASGADEGEDRPAREVMAEAVAYTVMGCLGLDTSEYSFDYIATWSSGRQAPELKRTLSAIQMCACGIVDRAEAELDRVRAERGTRAVDPPEGWACTDPDSFRWASSERAPGADPRDDAWRVVQPVELPSGWGVADARFSLSSIDRSELEACASLGYEGGLRGIADAYGTGPYGAPDFPYGVLAELVSERRAAGGTGAACAASLEGAARAISRTVLEPAGVGRDELLVGPLSGRQGGGPARPDGQARGGEAPWEAR